MMTQNLDKNRDQIVMICMDELVPQDHLLRKIDRAIDWSFIYDLVEDKYSYDQGRPSLDPVLLLKIPFIQYLYGIRSMRQTIKEIEVNMAYRWFLGLDVRDSVPHFTTFGKNYTRRFKDTDLFEQIFQRILEECYKFKLVDPTEVFVDATHVKAHANGKKMQRRIAEQEARFYDDMLRKEIDEDREAHGKKPLKRHDDDDSKGGGAGGGVEKEIKVSTTDPESGWFHKGEHKEVFAYAIETACDKHGWILGYTVNPGNLHDSKTFKGLFDKIENIGMEKLIADAGYKTPAIAKLLLDKGITPVFPYKCPQTKEGFFKKREYVYDEYFDCYLCPQNQILKYTTTNREGYREYKSDPRVCQNCPCRQFCTLSKNKTKVVVRHVWAKYLEEAEHLRHVPKVRDTYKKRKETIERVFAEAKERHCLRYTNYRGLAKVKGSVRWIV